MIKLSQGHPARPLLRKRMDKTAKESFKALIDALSLAIRLRVVSQTHGKRCLSNAKKLTPKSASENAVTIRNYMGGKTMQAVYVVKKELSNLLGQKWMQ